MKKILRSKVTWLLVILIMLISITGVYLNNAYQKIKDINDPQDPVIETEKMIDEVYNGYTLYIDSTDYQRELFEDFKVTYDLANGDENWESEANINYIDSYSKNFIADLLTLNVKNRNFKRIGGEQFVHPDLKKGFIESDGVVDYYLPAQYYEPNDDAVTPELPEITDLSLVETEQIFYDFYDPNNLIEDQLGLFGYTLTYDVTYAERVDYITFETIYITVVNWNGTWTVVEFLTDQYDEDGELINIY